MTWWESAEFAREKRAAEREGRDYDPMVPSRAEADAEARYLLRRQLNDWDNEPMEADG